MLVVFKNKRNVAKLTIRFGALTGQAADFINKTCDDNNYGWWPLDEHLNGIKNVPHLDMTEIFKKEEK